MTVKEEQKEEENYYLSSPQYRPNSPNPVATTTLVLIPVPGKKPQENQKMEEDAIGNLDMDSETDYDSDDTMDF